MCVNMSCEYPQSGKGAPKGNRRRAHHARRRAAWPRCRRLGREPLSATDASSIIHCFCIHGCICERYATAALLAPSSAVTSQLDTRLGATKLADPRLADVMAPAPPNAGEPRCSLRLRGGGPPPELVSWFNTNFFPAIFLEGGLPVIDSYSTFTRHYACGGWHSLRIRTSQGSEDTLLGLHAHFESVYQQWHRECEAKRAEAVSVEAARVEAAKVEAARVEAERVEAESVEAAARAKAKDIEAAKAAEVAAAAAAREAALRAQLEHSETIRRLSARMAVDACAAVVAQYPRRDRPNGQRSAAAKQRRRKQSKQRAGARGGEGSTSGSNGNANGGGGEVEAEGVPQLKQWLLAARLALKDRESLLALTRKQLRRETKTAKARWQQLARRDSKACKQLSRKLFAKKERDAAGAARRERERSRKRKRPEGEALHSGERKHQRLLGKGAGGKGRGGGSGNRGGSRRDSQAGKASGKGGRGGGGRGVGRAGW